MVTLAKVPVSLFFDMFAIRGETIYGVTKEGIFSAPLEGDAQPTTVVAQTGIKAAAFNDSKLYWAMPGDGVYACPFTGCMAGKRLLTTNALELAVDATSLYWIEGDGSIAVPEKSIALRSAPKDGTSPPALLAAQQNQARSLLLHDGFVYWTTSFSLGAVARCPLGGCPIDGPEVLAEGQYFPLFATPSRDSLFWMNGAPAPGKLHVAIFACQSRSCGSTIEQLDERAGGGYEVLLGERGTAATRPPREMVVDENAI